jgi:hypothetical protein
MFPKKGEFVFEMSVRIDFYKKWMFLYVDIGGLLKKLKNY